MIVAELVFEMLWIAIEYAISPHARAAPGGSVAEVAPERAPLNRTPAARSPLAEALAARRGLGLYPRGQPARRVLGRRAAAPAVIRIEPRDRRIAWRRVGRL